MELNVRKQASLTSFNEKKKKKKKDKRFGRGWTMKAKIKEIKRKKIERSWRPKRAWNAGRREDSKELESKDGFRHTLVERGFSKWNVIPCWCYILNSHPEPPTKRRYLTYEYLPTYDMRFVLFKRLSIAEFARENEGWVI